MRIHCPGSAAGGSIHWGGWIQSTPIVSQDTKEGTVTIKGPNQLALSIFSLMAVLFPEITACQGLDALH